MEEDDDISDPEEDSLAGQMALMRGGKVKKRQEEEESDDESSTDDHVQVLGGLGADLPLDQYKNVQVRPSENMWIPSEGDKGQWKQQATVTTSFRLSAPPTFETANMSISVSCSSFFLNGQKYVLIIFSHS